MQQVPKKTKKVDKNAIPFNRRLVIMNGGRVTNNDTILKLKETLNNRFHVTLRLKEETSVVEANMVKLRAAIYNIQDGGVITDEHTVSYLLNLILLLTVNCFRLVLPSK